MNTQVITDAASKSEGWLASPAVQKLLDALPWAFLCLVVIAIILKMGNDIRLKVGDKEVNLTSKKKEAIRPVVKVLTDYADWKADMQKEYSKDFSSMDTEARRITKLAVDSHAVVLQSAFENLYKKVPHPKQVELTEQCFKLILYKICQEETTFLYSIYAINHLHEKTDKDIEELVDTRYNDFKAMYHLNIQTYWVKGMVDAKLFFDACINIRDESRTVIKQTVLQFKKLSDKKYTLDVDYSKLDKEVKEYVVANAALPLDAYNKLHDLYKPNI